jgi:2-keto-4-pentenoate hydratase/2-oxohepta-3-ene-1,7-dioic acid hydratase in catechol pathway
VEVCNDLSIRLAQAKPGQQSQANTWSAIATMAVTITEVEQVPSGRLKTNYNIRKQQKHKTKLKKNTNIQQHQHTKTKAKSE